MSDEILRRAETCGSIGMTFRGKMTREQVMARLMDAQQKVLKASPRLLSDEFLFDGDEIHGKRRNDETNR